MHIAYVWYAYEYNPQIPLQCKYYSAKKKSAAEWGTSLKGIAVSYKIEEATTSLIDFKMRRLGINK